MEVEFNKGLNCIKNFKQEFIQFENYKNIHQHPKRTLIKEECDNSRNNCSSIRRNNFLNKNKKVTFGSSLLINKTHDKNDSTSCGNLRVSKEKLKIVLNENSSNSCDDNNNNLLKKHFAVWRKLLLEKKNATNILKEKTERKMRVDKFINKLEKEKSNNTRNTTTRINSFRIEEIKAGDCFDKRADRINNKYSYELSNRFRVQKEIINMQKNKLLEQAKIIEDLRMGKLEEELGKSLDFAKVSIREIFANCKKQTNKCKVIFDENHKNLCTRKFDLLVVSNKAPKILKKMEERALERLEKREIILKKKKANEEERKRIAQMEIENKKIQDEEERRRNVEAIKERRKRELKIQAQRKRNREIYEKKMETAINFYNRKLYELSLERFKDLVRKKKLNKRLCQQFNKRILLRNSWKKWQQFINLAQIELERRADEFYSKRLKRIYFNDWCEVHLEEKANMQVAIDYYDYKLQGIAFRNLLNYTCKMYVINANNLKKAKIHYDRKLLLNYFYYWKTLPSVLKIEKAKEEKKRKWREKVWQILPDYLI